MQLQRGRRQKVPVALRKGANFLNPINVICAVQSRGKK
jgi:hypothetical protein